MDGIVRPDARAAELDVEGVLFRAALLARYGRDARNLAARLASACEAGEGRSCVEAGVPLQFTVDAPGDAGLRVGLRLGASLDSGTLSGLMGAQHEPARFFEPLPPADHPSLGFWLFWSGRRQSIFTDLRDPEPARALERLRLVLDGGQQRRLDSILRTATHGRPWALDVELEEDGRRRLLLYWFVSRPEQAARLVEAFAPGRWRDVVEVLGYLLKRPGESGRWMLAIPLDEDRDIGPVTVGNSAWALVPEDERKHRAVGEAIGAFGGPRDYAEALWSLFRGAARPGWRVGRTCEVGLGADTPRVRLFFTPQVQLAATAGINSSASVDSSVEPTDADPSSA